MVYAKDMRKENIATAKAQLSRLVNAALAGEEVLLCKDGTPVVRLTPVRPAGHGDPCRVIPDLVVDVGEEAAKPLESDEWGDLV